MTASTRLLLAAASVLVAGTVLVGQNHDTPAEEVTVARTQRRTLSPAAP